MGRLEGKVAVITGANSGIGLAAAKLFTAEGARVFMTGRRKKELDTAVAEVGGSARGIQGDISKLADLDRLFATVRDEAGTINVLFANAGGGEFLPLGSITEEHFDRTFSTNVKGTLFTVQKALPLMEDGASIILTGSTTATKGTPAFSVYSRRPAPPWCSHRHHRRAPHLGLGADPPSAHPHDRARQWHLARWRALGVVPASVPAAGAGPFQAVPPAVLTRLIELFDASRLQFHGNQAALRDRPAFLRHLAPVRKKPWIVYAKPPFAGPAAVLAYLSRYTHRVAISNRRLLALDERGVTFRYKDYRREGTERYQVMTLATDEFIRRFLLHVLPRGFHRIRHYGLLASGGRRDNLARARELLATSPPPEPDEAPEPSDHRPPGPCCGGRMLIVETFERYAQPRAPPRPTCSPGRSSP